MTYDYVVTRAYKACGQECGNFTKSSSTTSGFPEADVEATKYVVASFEALTLQSFRDSLRNRAGEFTKYQMLGELFYPKALICTGTDFYPPQTKPLEFYRDAHLSRIEFIVPNQMIKRTGKTK